ncbi:MAG: FG-GAP repeat domain-containing protein, partial [Candidatus Hodarchaeales archaeon]
MHWRLLFICCFLGIILSAGASNPGQGQSVETDIQARNYFRYLGIVSRVEGLAWGLETFDYDLNGRPDLAIGLDNGSVTIYQYKGVGVFKSIHTISGLGKNIRGVAAGDLTLDGLPDLVVGNMAGQIQLLVNEGGNGEFSLHPEILADAGSKAYGVAVADFRGIGVLDIITGNSEGQILYFRNNGNIS